MRRYLSVIGALLALGLAGNAGAAPDVGVAVLGLETVDVPEALAQQVTDALRQRAAATSGVRVVQGKDLIEIKMIFNCDGEAPGCMAQAGKSLGADKLLYGVIKKGPKATFLLALKLLDVKAGAVEKFVNDSATKRELAAGQVNVVAGKWFAQLIEIDTKPTLTVTSDPTGALVTVDGTGYGKTPLTLRELSAGTHQVILSLTGRLSATRSIELRPGANQDLNATLDPEAPIAVAKAEPLPAPEPVPMATPLPPPSQPRGHPGRAAKIAGAALVGGALVTTAVAIYTWRTYVNYEGKAHDDLRGLTASDSNGQTFINKNPSCNVPGTVSGNVGKYKSDCSTGNNFANATTGLWIATGALAASGVVSFIVGDRQAAHAKAGERQTAAVIKQTLRVSPVFSTQGGGVSAAFEF